MKESIDPPHDLPLPAPGLIIRSVEPDDADAVAVLRALPGVRWGTLGLPYERRSHTRKFLENSPETCTALAAELEGGLVGLASVDQSKRRRSHAGYIGMSVHDSYRRRGVGSALMAALIDLADNWLNLKRLELTVFADNAAAIGLYEKFGFAVEGRARAYAFRDGVYVDALYMARIKERRQ